MFVYYQFQYVAVIYTIQLDIFGYVLNCLLNQEILKEHQEFTFSESSQEQCLFKNKIISVKVLKAHLYITHMRMCQFLSIN